MSVGALGIGAVAAGYALSSSWGSEILRREVERRLSDLLQGEVQIGELELTFSNGLGLRGQRVSAYPSIRGPGLYAQTVRAELRESALLLGQFALSSLALEELEVRIELDAEGRFSFPPLQWLQDGADTGESRSEAALLPVAAVGAVARTLLQQLRVADQLSIHGGSLTFEDRFEPQAAQAGPEPEPPRAAPPMARFQLQQIHGKLVRSWLSDRVRLQLDATLIDPRGKRVPLELRGSGAEDGRLRLSLEVEGLDLDALDPYLARLERAADLDGQLSGSVHFDEIDREHQSVDVDWTLHELVTTWPIRGKPVQISLPLGELQARLELQPGSVRLVRADARGPRAGFSFEAAVERPLRESSSAHLEIEVRGLGLADVRPVLRQLPETDLEVLRLWFETLQSGRVDRLELSGRAPLAHWAELARGELQALPEGFLLQIDTSDVTALLDDGERLTNLRFEAAFSPQRLEIREVSGRWQDDELPALDLTIEDPARFLEAVSVPSNARVAPLPGVSVLWDLLRNAPDAEAPRDAPWKLDLELDFVRHPLLRWPLQGVRLSVEPTRQGTQANLTAGSWGGIPIVGEMVYLEHPRPRLSVGLEALEPSVDRRKPTAPRNSEITPQTLTDEPWAAGSFEFALERHEPAAPTQARYNLSGDFELQGSRIGISHMQVALASDAIASVELKVDLAKSDEVDVELAARLEHARVESLLEPLGLPAGFATGTIDLDAKVRGPIRRGENPLSRLEGSVSFTAEDGQIAQKIPLVVAVASATGGFNPLASRDSLHYDTVQAVLRIDHGRLEAERLEIEGPIRVYASGGLEFVEPPHEIDAVVGVFLFQRARELLGMVPLVNLVIPGSDKGMVGAYFAVRGPWEKPEVSTLAMKSLHDELPDILTRPFELLHWLLTSKPPSDSMAPPSRDAAGDTADKSSP